MEQYLNAPVKRYVQKQLFSKMDKVKTFLGLAGPHPEEYCKVIPLSKYSVLVDFNPTKSWVKKNSLIGEYDLQTALIKDNQPINAIDCDFCKSFISNGPDLIYLYYKMKRSTVKNKYISFTFSLRGTTEEETLKWLSDNFPEIGINLHNIFKKGINVEGSRERQYVKQYGIVNDKCLNLYMYRDSGDNMIAGLIKL